MKSFEIDGVGTIHDFRPESLGWGWNGLTWEVASDKKSVAMMGVGKGLKSGHFIWLNQNGEDYYYPINEIKYDSNPRDMFNAVLGTPYTLEP
tara:strand:- start:935 stop:1210 length:276 start_codon:yes stop_codon:yes gene_type:complete